MGDLTVIQCIARCSALARWLADGNDGSPFKPSLDADTDTDTDTDAADAGKNQELECLEKSLEELSSLLDTYPSSAQNRRQDDHLAVKELASSCKSRCGRVLSALHNSRGPKRIATSLNTWKMSRPSVGNSRQGFELRKLSERLRDLQTSLTSHTSKVLTYVPQLHMIVSVSYLKNRAYYAASKHQIRQIQLDNRRFECQKSHRLKMLSSTLRNLETQVRSLQQSTLESVVSSDEIGIFKAQIQQIEDQKQNIKRDHAILKSLAFRSNVARHDTIPTAHQRTFSWVFSSAGSNSTSPSNLSLKTWLEQGSGIFWVSGKPGAGKSTLMKFIADHERTQEALSRWSAPKSAVIVSHYFWCAGTQMQRSHNGLLQTLLFVILRQLPDSIESLFPQRWVSSDVAGWTTEELYQALFAVIEQSDLPVKFCLFIDGLDEFEGDHVALCHELMTLAKSGNVKLCLSSRPWSVFEEAFGSGKMGHLRLHDVTKNDIVDFVLDRFVQHSDVPKGLSHEELRQIALRVSEKSQGVFLWVSLATKCLLEVLSQGHSSSTLFANLDQYPSELDEFFTYNLEAVSESDQARMATSLLITEAAEKPLDIGIYYFHEMEFADPEYVLKMSPEPPSRLEHRRQLSHTTQQLEAICRGLLAVDQRTKVVNCFHRTVKDYLDQAETKAMLSTKAPLGFSPKLCLVKASAAWTKSSRATMSEEPKAEFLSSITSLLGAAVQLQSAKDVELFHRLLDDLDGCLVAKGPGAEESLQILRTQVVSHRIWHYLSGIQLRHPGYFDIFEVPPLVLALFPDYEIGEVRERRPRWDEATTKTVLCLLEQGQDPNKFFSTAETLGTKTEKTPWIVLCEHVMPQTDDTHIATIRKLHSHLKSALEIGILDAFLSHGANPSAKCQRPGKSISIAATDYLLDAFRLSTEDDLEMQELYLQHVHWFTPKEADHMNAVINDFFRFVEKEKSQSQQGAAFLQKVSERLLELSTQLPQRR